MRLRPFMIVCPSCRGVLVAGSKAKKVFWVASVGGGALSGVAAIYARHSLGWSHSGALSLLLVGMVVVVFFGSALDWKIGDYKEKIST